MNVVKVLQIGPTEKYSNGGMATVLKNLSDSSLLAEGYEIDAYASCCDGPLFKRLWHSVRAYLRFFRSVETYDLFHIHMATRGSTFRKGYYIRSLKKRGKKVILHVHGAEYKAFYEGLSRRKKERVARIWNACDQVLVLSDSWYRYFRQKFPLAKICVIENGVDTDKYAPSMVGRGKAENLLFLGRLGKRKGAYDLVEAMERAVQSRPKLHLFMAGDGDIEEIKELIAKKGLADKIEVLGWVSGEERIRLLQEVRTLVLPSYNEGLPMAILEAMAAGNRIISTTVGGIPELVQPEQGILLEPGDVPGLAEALLQSSHPSAWTASDSQASRDLIEEKYSLRRMHEKIRAVYESVQNGPTIHGRERNCEAKTGETEAGRYSGQRR